MPLRSLYRPLRSDVLDRVVQGRPNKIIADDPGISQRTVENHRAAVMRRTGVASVPDLIRLVMAAADNLRRPDADHTLEPGS